jgi:hypothetical protein
VYAERQAEKLAEMTLLLLAQVIDDVDRVVGESIRAGRETDAVKDGVGSDTVGIVGVLVGVKDGLERAVSGHVGFAEESTAGKIGIGGCDLRLRESKREEERLLRKVREGV